MTSVNVEEVVSAYLNLRGQRDKIRQEYEAADAELKNDMAELEQVLLNVCNDTNASSIRTKLGTVIRSIKDRFFCEDWDNFYQFVLDNQAVQLLERRIHQSNFKNYIEEHQTDGMPPGVSVTREYGVTVRKSSSKDQ